MLCGRRSGHGDSAVTPVCATQCDGRDSSSVPEAECPRHSRSALHRESRADEGRGPGLGSKLGGCRLIGALKVIISVDATPQSEMTGSWMGLCFLPGESSVPFSSLPFRCKPGSFKHEQTHSLPTEEAALRRLPGGGVIWEETQACRPHFRLSGVQLSQAQRVLLLIPRLFTFTGRLPFKDRLNKDRQEDCRKGA